MSAAIVDNQPSVLAESSDGGVELESVRIFANRQWRRLRSRFSRKAFYAWAAYWGLDLNSNFVRCGEFLASERAGELLQSADGGCYVCGRIVCGNAICCPWCSPVKRELLADVITRLVLHQLGVGKRLVMAVFTFQHSRGERFLDVLADYKHCLRRLSTKLSQLGIERLWVFDLTVGRSGFHPHPNFLLVVPPDTDLGKLQKQALAAWRTPAKKTGRAVVEAATFFRELKLEGDELRAVAEYVAGVPHTASPAFDERWSVGRELTRGDLKGRTPFELLDNPTPANLKLYVEIVAGLRKQRLFRFSKGLHSEAKALGLDLSLKDGAETELKIDEDVPFALPLFVFSWDDLTCRLDDVNDVVDDVWYLVRSWRERTGDWGDLPKDVRAFIRSYIEGRGFTWDTSERVNNCIVVPVEHQRTPAGLSRVMSPRIFRSSGIPLGSGDFNAPSVWDIEGRW